jgi:hypothetical protein
MKALPVLQIATISCELLEETREPAGLAAGGEHSQKPD